MSADSGECDVLGREPGRCRDDDGILDLLGLVERPFEHLHPSQRATDDCRPAIDAKVLPQAAMDSDEVSDAQERKFQPVAFSRLGIDRAGTRRPVAATEKIGGHDEPPIRVDRLAGADEVVPPARFGISFVETCSVRVTGECMTDVDSVAAFLVELAVGFVGHVDLLQRSTRLRDHRMSSIEHASLEGFDDLHGAHYPVLSQGEAGRCPDLAGDACRQRQRRASRAPRLPGS